MSYKDFLIVFDEFLSVASKITTISEDIYNNRPYFSPRELISHIHTVANDLESMRNRLEAIA